VRIRRKSTSKLVANARHKKENFVGKRSREKTRVLLSRGGENWLLYSSIPSGLLDNGIKGVPEETS